MTAPVSTQWPWRTVPLGEIAEVKLGKMLDRAKHTTGRNRTLSGTTTAPTTSNKQLNFVQEESANLPAPEVIAQEIVDDLQAALEQFAAIADDLR